jgi:hypothetical protein
MLCFCGVKEEGKERKRDDIWCIKMRNQTVDGTRGSFTGDVFTAGESLLSGV